MGRIAAGVPVEAIETRLSTIEVPPELLAKGEHYALEVKGDSMIDAGILEGDTIIVRKCEDATNGDIVVAWLTKKRKPLSSACAAKRSIALEAANPPTRPAFSGPDRVRGRAAGRADPPLLGGYFSGLPWPRGSLSAFVPWCAHGRVPRLSATVSVRIDRPST
ncbi:MAG: S24 family peptidase [Hyphomicrobiales bacterium]